jgi:hypothetical protein
MRKFIFTSLMVLTITFLSGNFAFAQAPKPAAQNSNCTKAAGQDYYTCKSTTGGSEVIIQNYTCSRTTKSGTQSVLVPQCIVGGIFDPKDPDDVKCACCGDCKFSRFLGLFITISRWIFMFSGSAALAVMVYGGFLWILSGGNPERIKRGRDALTGAVIGVIIVISAWLIINFILTTLTGTKIGSDQITGIQTQFKANQK